MKDQKVIVKSPVLLTKEQLEKLEIALENVFPVNQPKIENEVDRDIAGGIVVKFGSNVLDLSVQNKINEYFSNKNV